MDLDSFVYEFLRAADEADCFHHIDLHVNEYVAKGRAHISAGAFLRYYYNVRTGTLAFALIWRNQRIWGVDYDNLMGWHRHPHEAVDQHIAIEPLSVSTIIQEVEDVIRALDFK